MHSQSPARDLTPSSASRGLRKSYGDFEAVRGIDLEVERGEIFAFLGPNGAGKTTTVEILEGYRERIGGRGHGPRRGPRAADREWRERIGIVLQQSRMHPELTVRETLELFAGYYARAAGRRRDDRAGRARRRRPKRGCCGCRAASSAGSTSRWR